MTIRIINLSVNPINIQLQNSYNFKVYMAVPNLSFVLNFLVKGTSEKHKVLINNLFLIQYGFFLIVVFAVELGAGAAGFFYKGKVMT